MQNLGLGLPDSKAHLLLLLAWGLRHLRLSDRSPTPTSVPKKQGLCCRRPKLMLCIQDTGRQSPTLSPPRPPASAALRGSIQV